MLFYRYISENITAYINEGEYEAGNKTFDYTVISDEVAEEARKDLVDTKGFFMLPSELFENVRSRAELDKKQIEAQKAEQSNNEEKSASYYENLNEKLESIFKNIESSAMGSKSEATFKGLFDDIDVNSNKLGATVSKRNEMLLKLINGIAGMKLNYQNNTIDAFGDTYEYLIGMYASNAGKSGGEYYTPQEVSELLTRIALGGKKSVNKVYDPACGSGSLLLQSAKILGKNGVTQGYFGQEINLTTYNICRINMLLHDIGFDKFDIGHGDTLTAPHLPHFDEEPFEVIVSNPPYSIKWAGDDNPILINDDRYSPAGVLAPKSKADMAFIMHSLNWLAENGTASIVCFPGILYRGGAEQKIRKYLVDENYIDCVIQLPSNLFFGTSIATCILVLKKSKIDNSILFIDASKEFVKVTNNNKLTVDKPDELGNIGRIVEAYTRRETATHPTMFVPTRLITNAEIAEQGYNLSVSTYVEQEDKREVINIDELNTEISRIVMRSDVLRQEIDTIVAKIEGAGDEAV